MKNSLSFLFTKEVAVASLFLAAKVEDQKVDVRAILTPCLEIKGLKYEETRNSRDLTRHILDNEILLLQVMNFHIKLDPPLAVAMQIFKKVFVGSGSENSALFYIPKDAQQEILKSLKSVLNSSNQTIVCCFASPKEIAVACIQMAILLYQMKTSETGRLDIPDDWFTSKVIFSFLFLLRTSF